VIIYLGFTFVGILGVDDGATIQFEEIFPLRLYIVLDVLLELSSLLADRISHLERVPSS
jgi:hypothetical protein